MTTLGFMFICKDEDAQLDAMLESVKSVGLDEMHCGWNGTNPKTEDVLKKHGATIHRQVWKQDFSAARQEIWGKCTSDFMFWLDADDILLNGEKIRPILEKSLSLGNDAIFFPYHYRFDENGDCICVITRERIVKRTNSIWLGRMDDCLNNLGTPWKGVHYEDVIVRHNAHFEAEAPVRLKRNLEMGKIAYDNKESLGSIFYYGRALYDAGHWAESEKIFLEFLEHDPDLSYQYYTRIMLANAYTLLENWTALDKVCDEALKIIPTCGEPWFKKAYGNFMQKNWDLVIEQCEKVFESEMPMNMRTPIDPLVWTLRPATIYAQALLQVRRGSHAFNVIQESLKLFPTNRDLMTLRELVSKTLAKGAVNVRDERYSQRVG